METLLTYLTDTGYVRYRQSVLSPAERAVFAQRLLTLRDLLATVPNVRYTHRSYVKQTDGSACGTVGCALGHAAANNHLFPGLNIMLSPGINPHAPTLAPVFQLTDLNRVLQRREDTEVDAYFGKYAFAKIFDIDAYHTAFGDSEGEMIDGCFVSNYYDRITPTVVIARINQFVAEYYGIATV